MSQLSKLVHLQVLSINGSEHITSAGLCQLTHLTLQELHIADCKLNDSELATVGEMSHLKKLIMYWNRDVTDAGLSQLTSLNKLQFLDIRGCNNVTATGRALISDLTTCCVSHI